MAARIGANFARRCMSQAAGNAKNAKTAKQISSLVIECIGAGAGGGGGVGVLGFLGVTGAMGAYKGYNVRLFKDRDGDIISKYTRIKRACAGAIVGPLAVPIIASVHTIHWVREALFLDK